MLAMIDDLLAMIDDLLSIINDLFTMIGELVNRRCYNSFTTTDALSLPPHMRTRQVYRRGLR